ncbi:hypothetical protein ABPG73_008312 [Tetrahymena malaccensis]
MIQEKKQFYSLKQILSSSLSPLTQTQFILRCNKFGDDGIQGLSPIFKNCHNIQTLNLSLYTNKLTHKGASDLGLALAQCCSLSTLNLDLRQKDF